jgi:hypothetical protein
LKIIFRELPETDWVLAMPAMNYQDGWVSTEPAYTAEDMKLYAMRAVEDILDNTNAALLRLFGDTK